jgi:hypothetical protein
MNERHMVLSARLSHLEVIGRDHVAPEVLYEEDRRDQFGRVSPHGSDRVASGCSPMDRWVVELAFQIETHGPDDVGRGQSAGLGAKSIGAVPSPHSRPDMRYFTRAAIPRTSSASTSRPTSPMPQPIPSILLIIGEIPHTRSKCQRIIGCDHNDGKLVPEACGGPRPRR